MNTQLIDSFECQTYKELATIEDAFALFPTNPQEWAFQLKYDGIWARVEITAGKATIWSKTGQLKHKFTVDHWLYNRDPVVLIGEFMFGSQWAQHPDRAGLIYVFDCLVFDGKDISTLPYEQRKKIADAMAVEMGSVLRKTDLYSVARLGEIWMHIEQSMKYEGLIIRNRLSTYFSTLYKLKTEVEDDYIVTGAQEGEGKHKGRLGALLVGQYHNNKLEQIMSVGGGFTDDERHIMWNAYLRISGDRILGLVVRVKGKARFSSGALRHPQFVSFRDDKKPEDCICKTS